MHIPGLQHVAQSSACRLWLRHIVLYQGGAAQSHWEPGGKRGCAICCSWFNLRPVFNPELLCLHDQAAGAG